MNKFLRLLFVVLMATFVGSASAEEVTMKYTGTETSNMTGENDAAIMGLDETAWSVVGSKGAGSNFPGLNKAGDFRLYYNANGGSTVTVTSLSGATITSIKLGFTATSYSNVSVTVGESDITAEEDVYKINSSSFVLGNANTSNTQVRITEVVIEYTMDGGNTKTATKIELSGDYVTRFTTGKDGDETPLPTATVHAGDAAVYVGEATWTMKMGNNWVIGEEEPSIGNGKVYIPNHSHGDLILTAKYAGDDTYEASSRSYTLKVYKGYMNIQDVLEQFPEVGGDTWAGKEAEWNKGYQASYWQVDEQFSPKTAIVTYANGSYTYIKDDYGSLLLYGSGLGFKKGDEVALDIAPSIPPHYSGVYGTLKAYNGLLELAVNKEDVELYVKSSDNPVEPKTITLQELNQTNMNEYLRIENAEFVSADKKNLTFKVGDETLAVYNQFNIKVADDESNSLLEPGTKYDLEGMGCIYWKNSTLTNQLYLISFEKVGDETGVKSLTPTLSKGEGAVYNLSGQPVTRTYRGITIQNARKVLR